MGRLVWVGDTPTTPNRRRLAGFTVAKYTPVLRTFSNLTNRSNDMNNVSIEEAYDLWLEDDSPVISFSECLICKAEGFPGQRGHSTTSCLADRLENRE